jgi:hypothetical protein
MLRKGLFRRGGNLPGNAEFEIESFDDPLGAGASHTRFEFFRRPLATANFHIAGTIGWHDQNTNGSISTSSNHHRFADLQHARRTSTTASRRR